MLCADGAWVATAGGLEFLSAPPLKQEVVEAVFADVLRRIDRQLVRLLGDPDEQPRDHLSQRDPALAALFRNAMLGNQADGKDAGKRQRVEFGNGVTHIKPHGRNCCQADGYSLHANTTVGPQAREALEKLCKYVCRPAIAATRLEQVDAATIRISLKNEWAGGVRAVLVSPRDLVIRALAQVPLPRRPSIRYHGCFAPNSHARAQVVPAGAKPKKRRHKTCQEERDEPSKMTWAECQKRALDHRSDYLRPNRRGARIRGRHAPIPSAARPAFRSGRAPQKQAWRPCLVVASRRHFAYPASQLD